MHDAPVIFSLFLVFAGGAVIATLALYARQPLLVAYIALGALFGPSSLDLVPSGELIAEIASIGILFLLFLLGLNLEPRELQKLFGEAFAVTAISSVAFAAVAMLAMWPFGFRGTDLLLIGACMMFSSTIIALKLLPTTALHHQRMGELIVSILLLQDMIAIAVMLVAQASSASKTLWVESLVVLVGLPLLAAGAWWFATRVLSRLYARFDQIPEYLFLLAIGWCLGVAKLATLLGLSHEVGAFVAGVTLATSPIARFIAESLKPLRDFFLVLFFFALGAGLDVTALADVWLPALLLAAVSVTFKPWVFHRLLRGHRETGRMAAETGARLGHISEFSLLIVVVAVEAALLDGRAALLLQTATILSFLASAYRIVRHYPTPIAVDSRLRRD